METRVIGYQSHGSVGVVQLATSDRNTFEYISSGEAIKNGLVTVTEVGGFCTPFHGPFRMLVF